MPSANEEPASNPAPSFSNVFLDSVRRAKGSDPAGKTDALERLIYIYETILGTTDDFIYIFDPEGRFAYANARLCQVYARTQDQVVGKTCYQLGYPTWHADMHMREIKEIVRTKMPFRGEVPFTGDSGIYGIYDYIFQPVLDADGNVELIIGTTRDVTERKLAEENLKAAQIELQKRADELEAKVAERTASLQETIGVLESFSYSIVHDMRAPLRSMQGYAEILSKDFRAELSPDAQRYIGRINASAQRMDQLIRDVLNFSKVSREEISLQPVDSDKLLREILETYPDLHARQEQIRLEGKLPVVIANEAALTQCFSNLLTNALKFTREGVPANVRVHAEVIGDLARIFVEDEGVGIAEHLHAKIFDLFHRATHSTEGTGIGLAIVKKSMERMGGQVGLTSVPDKGSSFWLELKLAPQA